MGRRLHEAPPPFDCLTSKELDALASVAGGLSLETIGTNARYRHPISQAHNMVAYAKAKLWLFNYPNNTPELQAKLRELGLPICYACFKPMHMDVDILVHTATGSFTCD